MLQRFSRSCSRCETFWTLAGVKLSSMQTLSAVKGCSMSVAEVLWCPLLVRLEPQLRLQMVPA